MKHTKGGVPTKRQTRSSSKQLGDESRAAPPDTEATPVSLFFISPYCLVSLYQVWIAHALSFVTHSSGRMENGKHHLSTVCCLFGSILRAPAQFPLFLLQHRGEGVEEETSQEAAKERNGDDEDASIGWKQPQGLHPF